MWLVLETDVGHEDRDKAYGKAECPASPACLLDSATDTCVSL